MSEGTAQPQGTEAQAMRKYQASSLVVPPRPDECGFPLREDEFQTLCEGEISEARAGRDLCIGSGVGALVGLAGVLANTDWDTIWQPGRRGWFVTSLVILLSAVVGSVAGVCIYQARLVRTLNDSSYSRLKKRISDWFRAQSLPGKEVLEVHEHDLSILSARYGALNGWTDVAPRLRTKIQNGKLRLQVTNDEFGIDPLPNVAKSLEVTYSRGGATYSRTVSEGQELSLPEG